MGAVNYSTGREMWQSLLLLLLLLLFLLLALTSAKVAIPSRINHIQKSSNGVFSIVIMALGNVADFSKWALALLRCGWSHCIAVS
jgi:hypothetical protein